MSRAKNWDCPILSAHAFKFNSKELIAAKGSLCHYGDRDYGYGDKVEWVPPFAFTATLTIEGLHSGRSAKWVTFREEASGRVYPMFIAELVSLIKLGNIEVGGHVTGCFKVVKRGSNFGIERVTEHE